MDMSLGNLWAPILLSAAFVFIASSIIHMVLKYHAGDYNGFSNEDDVRAAINRGQPAPKQYIIPWCRDMKELGSEAMQTKFRDGPVATVWLRAKGCPPLGVSLAKWFLYSLVVSIFAAYVASRTLHRFTEFGPVFRIAGTTAFLGYTGHAWSDVIWKGKPTSAALKETLDGLIYALLTATAFGWLWPR
jgi:hypothetical protein